jgi:hypothetical protein
MCLRRAPEKYIMGVMAPVGAALDRADLVCIVVSPTARNYMLCPDLLQYPTAAIFTYVRA